MSLLTQGGRNAKETFRLHDTVIETPAGPGDQALVIGAVILRRTAPPVVDVVSILRLVGVAAVYLAADRECRGGGDGCWKRARDCRERRERRERRVDAAVTAEARWRPPSL